MTKTNNTKQAFWIALGGLFSFSFGIISSMILSRYFPKADYGTFKQVLYVYTTMLMLFTLGLPKAYSYFLPRVKDEQAKSLIRKITNLFFLLGGCFSLFIFLASDQIALILRNPDLSLALKIFSPVPLLMLPTMGLEGILATYRMTKFMAIYTVITRVIMLCCVALPVLLFGGDYIQAIIGFVIASIIAFLLALYFKYYPVKHNGNEKSETQYKEIFQFSLPILYASLWGVLISSADQFFISRYFGREVFAEFANGSLELPFVGMIVGATAAVLSPIFSKMSHAQLNPAKEIFPIWKNVFEKSVLLIYPLLLYVWFFADIIMVLLYGEEYAESAIYFRIKSITNFFAVIVYGPLLINSGKVKYYANVHAVIAILVILLEYLSVIFINSPYAISGVSLLCQVIKTFLLLYMAAKIFNVKIFELFPLKLIGKIFIPSISILILDYYLFVNVLEVSYLWIFVYSLLFYSILFLIVSIFLKLNYISIFRPLLNRL